jgi:hypothetical protein
VLHLLVSEEDRHPGALVVVLCDSVGRLVQPVTIGEMGDSIHTGDDADLLRPGPAPDGTLGPSSADT